jgi:hypothetical protein
MEVSGQLHALAALPPREKIPDNHWIGGPEANSSNQIHDFSQSLNTNVGITP